MDRAVSGAVLVHRNDFNALNGLKRKQKPLVIVEDVCCPQSHWPEPDGVLRSARERREPGKELAQCLKRGGWEVSGQ